MDLWVLLSWIKHTIIPIFPRARSQSHLLSIVRSSKWGAKTEKSFTKMSEKDDGIRSAVTSANLPDVGTDRVDYNRQEAPSLSSHVSHSVSSAPFVQRNNSSPQQEVGKTVLSVSDATLPKTLTQQQANKKALSEASPSYDPFWRQKLGRSPALPLLYSTTTSTATATSTTQPDSCSVRGGVAASMMTPGVYHHPTNVMPPSMPIREVTQAEPSLSQSRCTLRPTLTHTISLTPLTLSSTLPSDRWVISTLVLPT